jgi:putative transposase
VARLPRLVAPGLPHLIFHRGHNGQAVFVDDADRVAYLQGLAECAQEARVAVHGYGLLPGEVRLLATPADESGLAEMMQAVGRRYVRSFNLKHGRSSTPWEGRFRSTVIEPARYFMPALLVVEAGLAAGTPFASATQPPAWTSAAHHLGLRSDPIVTEHAVFWGLGNTPFEREAGYRAWFERGLARGEVDAVVDAATKGWALGGSDFVEQLGSATGRRARPLPRGRPAKGRIAVAAFDI